MLPKDYPPYRTVYTYFRQWGAKPFLDEPSLLEEILYQKVASHRVSDEREEKTTLLIIDAQSVKMPIQRVKKATMRVKKYQASNGILP